MYQMNHVNIALDVFCIIISLLICIYLCNRGLQDRKNLSFFSICFFNILFILGDLSDWACNGLDQPWFPIALHVGQFVYYLLVIPLMFSLILYIYDYLSSYKKLSKWYLYIPIGISFFHLIGSFLTPFFGWYYRITDENIYVRGDLIFVTHILPVASYIIIICMTFQCHKLLQARTINALLSYAWMPLIGQLIQSVFRGVGTLVPAITLSILFIFINIQLDREVQMEKNKQALTEAQMMVMLSQIQPHFLYNALTSIRYLCETNPAQARESIDDFSIFLRGNMDAISSKVPIPVEQELKHVDSYLKLAKQRFGDTLNVVYSLETTDFCVPALSLQPLVENAIQHGIRRKEEGGTIRISSSETDECWMLLVEDDGVGFDTTREFDDSHVGLKNVTERLQLLCAGTLDMESTIGVGTKITMIIPKGN